jgi:hypothetical protein
MADTIADPTLPKKAPIPRQSILEGHANLYKMAERIVVKTNFILLILASI